VELKVLQSFAQKNKPRENKFSGRCGVSPLEGVAEDNALALAAARGRLSPPLF